MLEVKIDYQKLQVPTYSDQYSRIPHYTDNEKDMFICTAVFRKDYMEKFKIQKSNYFLKKVGKHCISI